MVRARFPLAAPRRKAMLELLDGEAEEVEHRRVLQEEAPGLMHVGDIPQRQDGEFPQEQLLRYVSRASGRDELGGQVEEPGGLHEADKLIQTLHARVQNEIVATVLQGPIHRLLIVPQETKGRPASSLDA